MTIVVIIVLVVTTSILFALSNAKHKQQSFDTENLYKDCTESHPAFKWTCENESCVEGELEQLAFAAWKKEFKQYHKLTEDKFNKHISISNVTVASPPKDSSIPDSVSIYYLYMNDWLKVDRSDYVQVRDAFSTGLWTEQEVRDLAKKRMNKYSKFDSEVISLDKLQKIVSEGMRGESLTTDFCFVRFENVQHYPDRGNVYGSPFIKAHYANYDEDVCFGIEVDLISGEVETSFYDPCIRN